MSQSQPPQNTGHPHWRAPQPDYAQPQAYQQQPSYLPLPETYYSPQQQPMGNLRDYPSQPSSYPPSEKPHSSFKVGLGIGCGFMVAVAIAVMVLVALASAGSHAPTVASQVNASANTPVATLTTFSVGKTATNGTWNVTVNSVKTVSGDQAFSPASGNIYVVIDVTSANISSNPLLVSSGASFTLKDNTGQAYNEVFTDIGKPPDGTVRPVDKLRGPIVYEVPKSVHSFTFAFQSNLFDANAAIWIFTV